MGERRKNEPEEPRGYVDQRSQSMSNSPGAQQAFGNIINQGPQPRRISQTVGDALIEELRQYPPEQFQITSMVGDAESGELGAVLQDILQKGGWQLARSGSVMLPGTPRGVIIEPTVDSDALSALVEWLRRGGVNPQVNRGEPRFRKLTEGLFGDSPPPPVHIVVGVLPQ